MRLDWWSIFGKLEAKACLRKADDPIIVEGPFAPNSTYLDALTNLTGRNVEAVKGSTGTLLGGSRNLAPFRPAPRSRSNYLAAHTLPLSRYSRL
ncbi:hypothetical protein [Brucella inopinata]|uniref:hypothetical protein n=1 Tax=Brucella TaxID=234 RepID=UPI003530577C